MGDGSRSWRRRQGDARGTLGYPLARGKSYCVSADSSRKGNKDNRREKGEREMRGRIRVTLHLFMIAQVTPIVRKTPQWYELRPGAWLARTGAARRARLCRCTEPKSSFVQDWWDESQIGFRGIAWHGSVAQDPHLHRWRESTRTALGASRASPFNMYASLVLNCHLI